MVQFKHKMGIKHNAQVPTKVEHPPRIASNEADESSWQPTLDVLTLRRCEIGNRCEECNGWIMK